MRENTKEYFAKHNRTIEFGDKDYDAVKVIEKVSKEPDEEYVSVAMLLFIDTLFGNNQINPGSEYYGDVYIDAILNCQLIEIFNETAYNRFMGHLLIWMPDKEVFNYRAIQKYVPENDSERFKKAVALLEKAKSLGANVEDDLKMARNLVGFLGEETRQNSKEKSALSSGKSNGGCYIATCVYGSYDCPEVWRLRRYRDCYLKNKWWGRLFIKLYYFISPKLVSTFGKRSHFLRFWKRFLDKKQILLERDGYSGEPYFD